MAVCQMEQSCFSQVPWAEARVQAGQEVGFKIGFNKRPRRRICRRFGAQADCGDNSIGQEAEFRNQQVAGSIPAGGSRTH